MPESPQYTAARVVADYVARDATEDDAVTALVAVGVAEKTVRKALRDLDAARLTRPGALTLMGF